MEDKAENITITIIGAGGTMGFRLLNNLINKKYNILLCEKSQQGIEKIKEKGLMVVDQESAIPKSDFIVMAVPDAKIGGVSKEIIPVMKKNATMIVLDAAAAYAGEIFLRNDCTFIVTHPCHPALFDERETPEEREDLFGGVSAKQNIVIALLRGKEDNFIKAKEICKNMFAPVKNVYRITVEQMTILEPVAAEVVGATCISVLKESLNEAIKCGVPKEAATAFMFGHINVALAIVFKSISTFTEACDRAIEYGYEKVFKENWKDVFKKEVTKEVVQRMLHPSKNKNK